MALTPVAFYAVADQQHFLGLVALLNSLRLHGHEAPLLVADCGLAAWQVDLLDSHVDVVRIQNGPSPHLLKPVLPLERPAETMVLADADLIVVRALDALLSDPRALVAFIDPVGHRFHPEWAQLLDLPGIRRMPYLNSGFLILKGDVGMSILRLVAERQERVHVSQTRSGGGRPQSPFYYADQDVWNAVVSATLPPSHIRTYPAELAPHPPFRGLTASDDGDLRYRDLGAPFLLHHVDRKPWLAATPTNLYSRLLPRLLLADDLVLRLEQRQVPARLRTGTTGKAARLVAATGASAYRLRGKIGLRRWLTDRRRARV